jgi:hypothetical protein
MWSEIEREPRMGMAGEEIQSSSLIARIFTCAEKSCENAIEVFRECWLQVVLLEGDEVCDNPEGSKDCVSQR